MPFLYNEFTRIELKRDPRGALGTLYAPIDLRCSYCMTEELSLIRENSRSAYQGSGPGWIDRIAVCHMCGWWRRLLCDTSITVPWQTYADIQEGSEWRGILRTLDVADIQLCVDELKRYLVVRYDERMRINPYRFEDLVRSIFKNEGWDARCTARGPDEGIDIVILDGPGDRTIGIQVKRTGKHVAVDAIRDFIGALVLQGHAEGVYVTTSSFSRFARKAAMRATKLGLPVRLWDADMLLDKLRVELRQDLCDADDPTAPWNVAARGVRYGAPTKDNPRHGQEEDSWW